MIQKIRIENNTEVCDRKIFTPLFFYFANEEEEINKYLKGNFTSLRKSKSTQRKLIRTRVSIVKNEKSSKHKDV
jgi:hypothetical protein